LQDRLIKDVNHVRFLLDTETELTRERAAEALRAIIRIFPELTPEDYYYKDDNGPRLEPFDPQRLDTIIKDWDLERNPFMQFGRVDEEQHTWDIDLETASPLMHVSCGIPEPWMQRHPERDADLVALCEALAPIIHSHLGVCHASEDFRRLTRETLWCGRFGIPQSVFWLNVWGPQVVERFGRDLIESFDWHYLRRFDYGGYLLQLSPELFDCEDPEVEAKRQRALEHFPLDEWRREKRAELAAIRAALGKKGPAMATYLVTPGKEPWEMRFARVVGDPQRVIDHLKEQARKRGRDEDKGEG